MWGLSGASHPLMTHWQPVPKQLMPPLHAVDIGQAQALPTVLQAQGIHQFSHISLAQLEGQAYYRVAEIGRARARYFAMTDGRERVGAEPMHAQALARYYTGLSDTPVTSVRLITHFEPDYHPINRILPVWRVDFARADGLRAYVDTEQSRLATLVDDRRAWLTQLFQWGHNWSFLASHSRLQLGVASLVLGLVLASALTGLVLYFKLRTTAPYRLQRGSLRWWHRHAGLWVSLFIVLLASSGMWHLWRSDAQQQRQQIPTQFASEAAGITAEDWVQLQHALASHQGQLLKLDIYGKAHTLFWQVIPAAGDHHAMPLAQVAANHVHGAGPVAAPAAPWLWARQNGQLQAYAHTQFITLWLSQLSLTFSAIESVQWMTSFANEYGFVFKRLPVLKIQTATPEHDRLYIEPATGVVAAALNDGDALEGFVFAYVHKWSVQFLPKPLRDALAIFAALLIASTGVVGAVLLMRPAKR